MSKKSIRKDNQMKDRIKEWIDPSQVNYGDNVRLVKVAYGDRVDSLEVGDEVQGDVYKVDKVHGGGYRLKLNLTHSPMRSDNSMAKAGTFYVPDEYRIDMLNGMRESTTKTLTKDTLIEGRVIPEGTEIKIVEDSIDNKEKSGHTKSMKEAKENKDMSNKLEEKTRMDASDRKLALIEFLGYTDPEDIAEVEEGWDETSFETPDGEYIVLTDDEADMAFREYQENLWDEMGLDSFAPFFQDWILENAMYVSDVDKRIFIGEEADFMASEPESYLGMFQEYSSVDDLVKLLKDDLNRFDAFEYSDGEFSSVEEMLDSIKNQPDTDSAIEELISLAVDENVSLIDIAHEAFSSMLESEYDDDILEYIHQMTGESKGEIIDRTALFNVDLDKVIEEIKSQDGRGGSLASYDGAENEVTYEGIDFFIYRL